MADHSPAVVIPTQIHLKHGLFRAICHWPFADSFVGRLLRYDIPQRIKLGNGRMWAYLDAAHEVIGFGSIDVCSDYSDLTGGKPHPYIPLLAVNPESEGRGYGKAIVRHLIGEAALLAVQPGNPCHDVLFLDVYTTSVRAIGLYEKCGFLKLRDQPLFDDIEQQTYFIMSQRILP
ncbi:MAG TPA: GNAT family N-acetyltransferase [Humisphaera sp.]|jgi:ribosomal protein S18 acetylase RimI-like enzyme|nr:GNAT family N-acetyltransferase [Humisphaera sp.]